MFAYTHGRHAMQEVNATRTKESTSFTCEGKSNAYKFQEQLGSHSPLALLTVVLYILLATFHLNTSRVPITFQGSEYKTEDFPAPSPVEYSNARVLKARLQNLLAPCHRNNYHYQIKLVYLCSQSKRYPEPPSL